ncbi:hypothetical protein LLB_1834 [Legionella longbeachae D-4968]|nr:hypothetical protein LLB_1834 [Legionella longbeachae D-4968]
MWNLSNFTSIICINKISFKLIIILRKTDIIRFNILMHHPSFVNLMSQGFDQRTGKI